MRGMRSLHNLLTNRYLILAVLLAALLLRVADLDADTPFFVEVHYIDDEGGWAHNARQYFLTGQWDTTTHNAPFYTAPGYSYLLYGAFKLNGLSLRSARLLSVFAGTATVLFLWLFLLKNANILAANAGAFFLAFAGFHVIYSRLALAESLLTAMLVLTLLLWSMKKNRLCAFSAGFLFTTMFVMKITAFYFIPIFGLLVLLEILREEVDLSSILISGSGALAASVLYGLWLVVPHTDAFRYWYIEHQWSTTAGVSPKYLFELLVFHENVNFRHGFFNKMLLSVPVLFIVTIFFFINFVFDMGKDWRGTIRKLDYAQVVGLSIVLGNAIVIGLSSYKPERRYLPLLPGMSMLATYAVQAGRNALKTGEYGIPVHLLSRVAVLSFMTLPMYVFACWAFYSLWGPWTISDVGSQQGVSFNGQTFILLPCYAAFLYFMHRGRILSDTNNLISITIALFLSHIMSAWLHFILQYYGIEWDALRVSTFTIVTWVVLYVIVRSAGPLLLRWRLHWILIGYLIFQGSILLYTIANPTYTYRDMGADAGGIMERAPLASDITAPFIDQDREILYGLPKQDIDVGSAGAYYVLGTMKKGNLPADGGRLMILGEQQRLPKSAEIRKVYPVFPYGRPEQYNLVLCLWEVRCANAAAMGNTASEEAHSPAAAGK